MIGCDSAPGYTVCRDRRSCDLRRPARLLAAKETFLRGADCLAVAQVLLGTSSEHHRLRICYGRLVDLLPYLCPKQPGNRKRLKAAAPLLAAALDQLARQRPSSYDPMLLIDATPVPCGTPRETVKRSDLAGWASYARPAHSRWSWGLRLYLITTPSGMPVV
jgi:hypothetical protein